MIDAAPAAVVLVAHGSRDPRAAEHTRALAAAVAAARPGWDVYASFLDHSLPRPVQVLAALDAAGRPHATLMPLLLTAAYHGRVDIPAEAAAARAAGLRIDIDIADVLGPLGGRVDPLLLDALTRRLHEAASRPSPSAAGPTTPVTPMPTTPVPTAGGSVGAGSVGAGLPGAGSAGLDGAGLDGAGLDGAGLDGVVLVAAGTRDSAARATVGRVAAALGARLGVPCTVAYASAAPPAAGVAVARLRAAGARRVGVAAYFLAPGLLYDAAVRSAWAAGATAVAAPLGDAPDLVHLLQTRITP